MRDLLNLYLVFFKLGIVNFGGGYAMLPLLDKELCEKRNWTTTEELSDYYAVGQCTPGAIAVNVSTFIGLKRKGILGGIIATLGFISPAFIIIFIIASLLNNFSSNPYVANALAGIRVCVFFLVLFAITKLVKNSIKDYLALIIALVVGVLAITVKVIPLYVYVIIAGVIGITYNVIKEKKKNIVIEKIVKEEKPKKSYKKNIIFSALGFLAGLILGIFAPISTIFIKQENYIKGVYSAIVLWGIALVGIMVWIFLGSPIIFILYLQFFKVGICAFGGGLATIPFLSELGSSTGWFTELDLANMIAVSESTPGAMGINMSTYVGYTVLYKAFDNVGLALVGSMVSTLGLVTPSIIVISIVYVFLARFKANKYVEYVFYGLRAASIGLIVAALYSILKVSLFNQYAIIDNGIANSIDAVSYSFNLAFKDVSFNTFFKCLACFFDYLINWKALGIGVLLGIGIFKFKKHPVLYIAIAAVLGIIFQMSGIIYL